MPTSERTALVVTSAHWPADPRLNRHVEYLRRGGWAAQLVAHHPANRAARTITSFRVIGEMARRRPEVVVLPNPELHVIGSIAARLLGIKPVLDIQEDYSRVAATREWIPTPMRPLVRVLTRAWEWLGRKLADAVVVAAPELFREGDFLVMNMPDPAEARAQTETDPNLVVYVGDVTRARGAIEMVEVLCDLGPSHELLVVGRVDEPTRAEMERLAAQEGVADRLHIMGRLDHADAWERASRAVAGLCLLRPEPAYLAAVATKIFEYMAYGVPPVVSDLPGQAAAVSALHPELVCSTPEAAANVIRRLGTDLMFRKEVVERGVRLADERWEEKRPDLALQRAVEP